MSVANCTQCGRTIHALAPVELCAKCRGAKPVGEPVTATSGVDRQRTHWDELHRQAEPTPEWFSGWQARIPNINCDCRRHWRELVAAKPPDFSSREAFFAWTVEAHNAVNERLGKPLVTLEEARRLHAPAA